MQAAGASNLKRTTLELGGKSPNVIFPDVDSKKLILLILISCTCVEIIII
jgi:acyl-CoA reductase-like NAD-dependent aldehyde dehydrogenase